MKMTIIFSGLILATAAHAETCKPPNVTREVYPLFGSGTSITLGNRVPSWQLACPGGGLLIPVWQGYMWLRHGVWPEISLATTWAWFDRPLPVFHWVGVQRIVAWLFDQATSAVTVFTGIAIFLWGGYLART